MRCEICDVDGQWAGNYEGGSYDCPKCITKGTLKGVNYLEHK